MTRKIKKIHRYTKYVWKVINESPTKNENNKQINIHSVGNNQDIINKFDIFFATVRENIANNIITNKTHHNKCLYMAIYQK